MQQWQKIILGIFYNQIGSHLSFPQPVEVLPVESYSELLYWLASPYEVCQPVSSGSQQLTVNYAAVKYLVVHF